MWLKKNNLVLCNIWFVMKLFSWGEVRIPNTHQWVCIASCFVQWINLAVCCGLSLSSHCLVLITLFFPLFCSAHCNTESSDGECSGVESVFDVSTMSVGTWSKFLCSYDAVAKRRGETWLQPVAEMLIRNDYLEADELEGVVISRLDARDNNDKDVPEVMMAVVARVLTKLQEARLPPVPAGSTHVGSAMGEIAKLLGKTEPEKVVEPP